MLSEIEPDRHYALVAACRLLPSTRGNARMDTRTLRRKLAALKVPVTYEKLGGGRIRALILGSHLLGMFEQPKTRQWPASPAELCRRAEAAKKRLRAKGVKC